MSEENRKDLPQPTAGNFQQRLRETMQTYLGRQGDPLDRGLTLRDLIQNGIVKLKEGISLQSIGSGVPQIEAGDSIGAAEPDLSPPPTPEGFTATPSISHVMIEHSAPKYERGHGHFRTRVYGAKVTGTTLPTFDKAVEVGQFSGSVWAMPSNPLTTWRLWIKWESVDGVLSTSPAGGTNGLEAKTGRDVSSLVLAMTGAGNPFKVVSAPMTLADGTEVPVGVYMADAFIHRMQVQTAMISDAAITNAKVASLSADKLTAGSIDVGQAISSSNFVAGRSGWSIDGNGAAEFSNATVRGTVYASAGEIGGAIIGSASVRSSNYASGSDGWMLGSNGFAEVNNVKVRGQINGGSFSGDSWPWNGGAGFHLGPNGLRIGDYWAKKYFQITSTGNVYAPQFSIVDGTATFSGNLSANIVRAENIISSSATSFQQSNVWIGNGSWQPVSFYMDHNGVVAVIGSITFQFYGSTANWSVRMGIDQQGGNGSDGNYWSSAGPPSIGVMNSTWLESGWHTVWVYANHTAATGSHLAYLTILRSYR